MIMNKSNIEQLLATLFIVTSITTVTGLTSDHDKCLTLSIGNGSDTFWNNKDAYQTLQITTNFIYKNLNIYSTFLKKYSMCTVVLVTDLDILLPAINMLEHVGDHVIVYSGTKRPPETTLMKENKPLVVIKRDKDQTRPTSITEMYCPRKTLSNKPDIKQAVLPKEYGSDWMSHVVQHTNKFCSNILSEQTLYGATSTGQIVRNGRFVGGYYVKLFWYLGEKFNFNAVYKADNGGYNVRSQSFVGMSNKTLHGEYFTSSGIITEWFFTKFDFMPSHFSFRSTFASRVARPVNSYGNIAMPFSFELWIVIVVTSISFAMAFYATYQLYNSNFMAEGLHKNEDSKINFLLFTVSKVTEPDPLPWFTEKWSTGKFITALWTVWALFMVLCYTSNLRAHMTSPRYEKSLDTVQDVADNGKVAWLPGRFVPVQPLYLERTGQTDRPLYVIAKKASQEGSYITGSDYTEPVQDALEKRGVIMVTRGSLPHMQYEHKEVLKGERLYQTREDVTVFPTCFILRKNHYMYGAIHKTIQVAIDFGLTQKWVFEYLPNEFTLPQSLIKKDSQAIRNKNRPLSIEHMATSFLFYSVTILAACIVFIMENRRRKWTKYQLKLVRWTKIVPRKP